MRVEQLTFTRFIAAMSIIVYHFGRHIPPFNSSAIAFFFEEANIAVSYFFVLSGFVMILAYHQQLQIAAPTYYRNRLLRIYPSYFFALVLLLIFRILVRIPIDIEGFFLNLSMLQAWLPGRVLSFNYPGWSLSVELFFYAVFPLLYNQFYAKTSHARLLFPILLLWMLSQILFNSLILSSFYVAFPSKSHDFLYYFPFLHLNEFLVGNLTGLLFVHRMKGRQQNYDGLLILLFLLLLLFLRFPFLSYHNGLLALLFVPMLLLLASNDGWITRLFCQPFFVFLGEISFSLYILQYPVYEWTHKFFNIYTTSNETLKFYSFLFLLILSAIFAFYCIEKPVQHYAKRWKKQL